MSTRRFERSCQIALTAVLLLCAAALQGCPRRNCPACPEPSAPPPPPAASCGSDPADVAKVFPNNSQGAAKHPNILLLSGGGSWGAYGAGILKGWSQSGSRPPQFDIVTGTSTGALIATYAFLGSNFDDKLEDIFTDVEDGDIYTKRFALFVPFSNSLNTLGPLRDLVNDLATDEIIGKVKLAYENEGRQLWVATIDFDSGEFCAWNLTKLAADGKHDEYRNLLVASSANPVIFNPVEIDGALHFDGGVRHQLFVEGVLAQAVKSYSLARQGMAAPTIPPKAWVVVNGQLEVRKQCVTNNIFPILLRAVMIMTHAALIGDLFEVKDAFALPTGSNFDWEMFTTRVPPTYPLWVDPARFNKVEMSALWEFARARAQAGTHWEAGIPSVGISPLECID